MGEARIVSERALHIRERQGNPRGVAAAESSLAYTLLAMKRYSEAITHFQRILDFHRVQGDRTAEASTLAAIAGCEGQLGNNAQADLLMNQAVQIDRALRTSLDEPERRAGFSEATAKELSRVLFRMHRYGHNPTTGNAVAAFLATDDALGRHFIEVLPHSDTVSLDEIRHTVLGDDSILLEYWLGDPESYLWILSRHDLKVFTLSSGSEIQRVATQLYNNLTVRAHLGSSENVAQRRGTVAAVEASNSALSHRLSELLLAPAGNHLESKHVFVASSGILSYLPFAALPDPLDAGKKPLGLTHQITNIPSAMAAAILRRARKTPAHSEKLLALLADPLYQGAQRTGKGSNPQSLYLSKLRDAAMARLPYARREAESILTLASHDRTTLFQGVQASRAAIVRGDLNGHRIIHFATHGFVDTDEPSNSGILLSSVTPDGLSCDGMLRLHDVYKLRLSAELVVLSACETALGKEFKSEATLSLTGAFLSAGASQVVSTAWKIDDEATAEFMKVFYQNLLRDGHSPGEALRFARIEISSRERWKAPYFWAGFLIHGLEEFVKR